MRNVLLLHPTVIEKLVSAALVLHNFLRENDVYCPVGLRDTESVSGELLEGSWRQDQSATAMQPLVVPTRGHNATIDAKYVRDRYKLAVGKMLK